MTLLGQLAVAGDGPDVNALLDAGRVAWSQGRRDDAIRRWRLASATDPGLVAPYANLAGSGAGRGSLWVENAVETLACDDPVIFKNLGVLALRRGSRARAMQAFRRALVLAPDRASTHEAFAKMPAPGDGQSDALSWAVRAALLRPDDDRSWLRLLGALVGAERVAEAARWVGAIAIPAPDWSTDLLDIASQVCARAGLHDHALRVVDLLIGRRPLAAVPRMVRAVQSRRAGDRERAVREARRAVLLDPGNFDALGTSGTELCHAEKYQASIVQFERALIVAPRLRTAVIENYAVSLQNTVRAEEGDALLREQLVWQPERAKSYVNLSSSAMRSSNLEAAARLARLATVTDDGFAEGHYQLGFVRRHQGWVAAARERFARAISIDARKPDYAFAQSVLELGDGDPVLGAASYESRWNVPSFPSYRSRGSGRELDLPRWQGDVRPDDTLALWGEQGVGDELWFAGYLEWALQRVGRVLLEVTPHLVDLMSSTFPMAEVLPRGEVATESAMAAADLQLPMGSLLSLSGGGSRSVPTGYLKAAEARAAQLRERYTAGRPGVRVVGLSWRSVKPRRKLSFAAPLDDWQPIFALPDTVFVSLQYGAVEAEARRVQERFGVPLIVDPEIDALRSLGDFAAQVEATDTVVSIANSTVAMAHGLDKPMHVLLKIVQEDWRYHRHQETTRWLPTARCVWQTSPGDWSGPLADVAARLRQEQ